MTAQGALQNAFVYIKAGLGDRRFPPPAEAVVLEQRGCQFVPRVLALRAGQTLMVKNADPVSHNIHPTPRENRDWNQQQPPGAPDLQRKFAVPEVMIPVKCNVHNWMRSYIGVLDHPYLAVTGPEGRFAWPDLPPGRYTLAVWHEALGQLTREVEVEAGQPVTISLAYRD
ncbi:MAG: carboxypeptidase regulatory-like domain-containing protein [Acidobacteriaceae bacterium]|nr:carboxypeptidase regulatory-like domain-containing protein [Acidobacteriaceae bacterium]